MPICSHNVGDFIEYRSLSGHRYEGIVLETYRHPYVCEIKVTSVEPNPLRHTSSFCDGDRVGILPAFLKYTSKRKN